MTFLVLAHPRPADPPRPGGVTCPACSLLFNFRYRCPVVIKPQEATRLPSGAIVIENPTVICASCAGRGVETIL